MADSKTPSTTTVILSKPEDWESWFWNLRANVNAEIWPCINPDQPERALLDPPERPQIAEFNPQALTYAQLTQAQQKAYDNARRYFDQDMKYYSQQQIFLKEARSHITSTVSPTKSILLDPDLSVREWLVRLKKNTEPTRGYMVKKTVALYVEALKPLKGKTFGQWLDRWEYAIEQGRKYNISEVHDGRWLRDLAQAVQPLSQSYFERLTEDAEDDTKADPSEYLTVARKLREALGTRKSASTGQTARGGAFNVSFGKEDPNEDSEATTSQGLDQDRGDKTTSQESKGRKRAGTRSQGDNPTKKAVTSCPACDVKGHDLPDCWVVFEEKRPEDVRKPSSYRVRKVKEALANDKELATRVKEIRKSLSKIEVEDSA